MCNFLSFGAAVLFLALAAVTLRADTFQLADGTSVTGDIVLPATAEGLNFKNASGKYQRVPWASFTQEALQELVKNPKLKPFAEPLIEISVEEKEKTVEKEVEIKPVTRLDRAPKGSVLGALFGSPVGLLALLLIYLASLYAAYEISIVRAYPAALVCGISTVAPIVTQIVFLCLPTKMNAPEEQAPQIPASELERHAHVVGEPGAAEGGLHISHDPNVPTANALPEPQVFARGKFTFNKRFIETKFPGFFGVVRRDAEKDMILLIKTGRDQLPAHRITRTAPNEMFVEIRKGAGTTEVQVQFAEIREIILKHKDT